MTTKDFEAKGYKRWQKNGMDRIYINPDMEMEYDERPLNRFFNRYERQNVKVYWDVNAEELVVTMGSDEAKEATKAVVEMMLKR